AAIKLQQPPVIPGDQFLEWLANVDSQQGFDLIVASTESSLLAMMQLPEQSSMRRRAVLPPQASLEIALDKNLTLEVAAKLGVPLPGTRLLTRVDEIGLPAVYPTVLKPVRSTVVSGGDIRSLEPAIVNGAAARRAALEKWLPAVPVLEQEYVQGWGAGIEMLYENGKLVWYLAHERLHEWPMTGGASTYRRAIEPDPQMLDAARRLFDELKWHGVGMAEFKRRKDGSFALMEINPRLWGSLALSIDAGVDFPLGLLRIATGADPGPQPNYRRGMRTRHLSRDIRWLKCNAVADRSDALLLLRPKLKSIFELGLFVGGREHWDHFRWTDPKPFLHDTFRMVHESLDSLRDRVRTRSMLRRRIDIVNRAVERAVRAVQPRFLFVCQGNICR
ncbi:MAG: ATP-grasp domain-containing protein, partial [Candidatus Acidiferrales bacterium]